MLLSLEIPLVDADHLRIALAGLTAMNTAVLQRDQLPPLYESGVVYARERPDRWQTADIVIQMGFGDCEDLAAWRAAELRVTGEDSQAIADVYRSGPRQWHAVVRRGDGTIEDPSRVLGMGRGKRRRRKAW